MVIDAPAAQRFISNYKQLLAEVQRLSGGSHDPDVVRILVSGRQALNESPQLLNQALASLEERGEQIAPDVLRVVGTLRLRQWVYLRDTAKWSIFLAPEEREAFGVLGLTDSIRSLTGKGAATFQTGVVEYGGRYVCDGLFSHKARIGPNYKRDFEEMFKAVKAEGGFRVANEL